jgi:hypothetical protein
MGGIMLKARATTLALGIALIIFAAVGTASPARADRGFGFHHHPFFFHSPFFFHDRFFFGFPVPYPAVTYYPPVYYAPRPYYAPPQGYPPPPPPPSYYRPGATGAPPPSYPLPPQGTAPGNCREFQRPINLEGRSVMAYCVACQQPNGSWRIIP